jgi:mono/diheme cytochrome c family protein
MTDDYSTHAQQPPPTPNPDLSGLERLVGSWNVSGGARGEERSSRRGRTYAMPPKGADDVLPMPSTASCRQVPRSPTQARAIDEARGVRRA